jgi:hypothetical protein
MPPRENSPYRLLVEGADDQHSIIHLLSRHGFDWDDKSIDRPYVDATEGVENLLLALPATLKSSKRVGVVVDANSHLSDRWAQLRSRADIEGVQLPDVPDPNGTIVAGFRPNTQVGVWLMPDNLQPGTLESFLVRLLPEGDTLWPYAGEVVAEARTRGARCKEKDHLKGALHTWLAWQENPGRPFGMALGAEVFRHDTPDALRFVAWFRRLFV